MWQFLADMPYGSVSLCTVWKIFWNIYCKRSSGGLPGHGQTSQTGQTSDQAPSGPPVLLSPETSPQSPEEIQEALQAGTHKDQFVDRLMKTYTSEAVYLLTTLVNMARARSCDQRERSHDRGTGSHGGTEQGVGEQQFIDVIVLEIFEVSGLH